MILGNGLKNLETNIKKLETNVKSPTNLKSLTKLKSPIKLVKENESTFEIEKKQIKKKNNKDERNFNIKNGMNPNLQNDESDKKFFNIKNGINPNLQNDESDKKLFNIEEINIKQEEKSTVELKGIKQIKKKKKINYDDL